jgi:hypothetical protein
MGMDYNDIYELGVESDCCGASVVLVDVCNKCKEHCTPIELEERELMDDYRDVGMSPRDFIDKEFV